MYCHTFVKVSVTVAVAAGGGAVGSQYNNALEVSWPRLGVVGVSLCLKTCQRRRLTTLLPVLLFL